MCAVWNVRILRQYFVFKSKSRVLRRGNMNLRWVRVIASADGDRARALAGERMQIICLRWLDGRNKEKLGGECALIMKHLSICGCARVSHMQAEKTHDYVYSRHYTVQSRYLWLNLILVFVNRFLAFDFNVVGDISMIISGMCWSWLLCIQSFLLLLLWSRMMWLQIIELCLVITIIIMLDDWLICLNDLSERALLWFCASCYC